MILSDFLGEALHFLRPGELRGSYTDQDLARLGFRRASNGAWYMDQARWERLVAQGQLREQQALQERVSTTLYHYTGLWSATQILESGEIQLSSTLGTDVEQSYAPPGYPYFLSATRTLTGGYHDFVGSTAVMFVLDGSWFNARYPGRAVDYWGNRDPLKMHHRRHEAEDRIFSREPTISLGGVRAVHVLVKPETDAPARARRLLIAAKRRGIPVYLYDDEQAWRRLDRAHTVSVAKLAGADDGGRAWSRGHRGYLMPWMELIFGKAKDRLSDRADKIRYNLNYDFYKQDAIRSLAVDLSNARKPNSGPDREHVAKIIALMRRERLTTLTDLANWIRDRWTQKAVSEDRDLPAEKIQQAVLDFYDRHTPDQAPVPDYVDQARDLLHQAGPGLRDQVLEILKRGRKNPYIQGGVITAVGAILAGAALTSAQRMGLTPTQTNMLLQALLNTVIPTMVSRVNGRNWRDTIKYTLASMGVGTSIAAITERDIEENFADGRKPGRKGLSRRVGIPRKASLAQLAKIAQSSTGERRRMAQWQLNMRRGRARKNK